MKYYTVNQDLIEVNGVSYNLNHSYMVPYERNDLYLSLINEQTPQNPDSTMEIDMGSKLYADIDYEYNYFASIYQNLTTQLHNSNLFALMPSLNAWLLMTNEMIDMSIRELMFTSYKLNGDEQSPDRVLSKDFFNERQRSIDYFNDSGIRTQVVGESRNILPGYNRVEFINKEVAKVYVDSDNKREMFPMFSKFKLSGVEKTEICNLLEQYELDSEFIDFLVSTRNDNKSSQPVDFNLNSEFSYLGEQEKRVLSSLVCVYRYDDFVSFVEEASDKVINEPSKEQSACEYFESFLKAQVFKVKAKEMIKNMPIGNAFPVAFRVEKQSDEGDLYSVHYFFNYTDLETFLFFDTQVAYRKEYVYDVRVVNMLKTSEEDAVFIEEPYYKESIFILDSPPIAPDVELITYRGVDNKVLIMFNQMVDKRAEVPVYINPSDTSHFKDQYKAQNIEEGLPIIFESDDPADFEFFRLNKKPVVYQEFSNENYKVIQSHDAYSAAYEDTVIPNQTYYYMFRTQDRNGFVSNPSPIYEFVLVKEGETLYPRIRIVSLAKPEPPSQKEKKFKKYVKIGLSPRQYLLPKESLTNLEDAEGKYIDIGVSTDNILASSDSSEEKFRKFKFRIRSKNTGKLIDINVTFKKNKVIKA